MGARPTVLLGVASASTRYLIRRRCRALQCGSPPKLCAPPHFAQWGELGGVAKDGAIEARRSIAAANVGLKALSAGPRGTLITLARLHGRR